MTKAELITNIAETTGFTKKDIRSVLDVLTDVTYTALRKGDEVKVIDSVVLKPVHREARTYRNPITGEPIATPAKMVVKASFGKRIKDFING